MVYGGYHLLPYDRTAISNLAARLKSELKGQIVSKFDLSLLNAYKPMYFDRNISKKGS